MPYFKDADYNCAPKNEDAQVAESIGFRNIAIINVYKPCKFLYLVLILRKSLKDNLFIVSKFDVRKLKKGVKEQALAIEANRLISLREELQNQLASDHSTFFSDGDKKAIENQIETVQRQIYDVNSLPEEKLCDLPPTMFDWQKIAIENVYTYFIFIKYYFSCSKILSFLFQFQRSRTPDQLRLHWFHYLRPGVNCRSWSLAESMKLKVTMSFLFGDLQIVDLLIVFAGSR